jgi:tetratricopeptide (TPR) repeat protein
MIDPPNIAEVPTIYRWPGDAGKRRRGVVYRRERAARPLLHQPFTCRRPISRGHEQDTAMIAAGAAHPDTAGTAPLLLVARGHDLLRTGRLDAALAEVEAALDVAPAMVDALLLRGACLKALGRFAEAVAAFEAGLAAEPARAAARVALGNAYAELGDLAAAEACLRRALALNPRLNAAHASLISVCAMQRRDDVTEAACQQALEVDPRAVNAHLHLADLRARAGQVAEARFHRDAAYRRQNLFHEPATRPAPTALVLLTEADGNIPLKYLLSRDRFAVVKWLIDYATPEQAASLPRHDFVFNAIGEPEVPAATHAAVERFRQTCEAPFLNRPDRVARTARTALPALLEGLPDVLAPRAVRWRAGRPPPTLGWPLLARPVGSHGGEGLARADDAVAFSRVAQPHAACDVTAFHEFASSDGLYRKYRMIFVDRKPFPYHLAIGDHWLVHYVTADMLGHAARRAEERRFLDDPGAALGARALAALAAIGARLDLEYAGIDFSLLPDGRVLVFEANATMVVHPETPGSVLAYKNRAVREILDAFDRMAGRGRA